MGKIESRLFAVKGVEKKGILAITRSTAIICNRLEVPNRQGNYPFSKFTS